MGIGKGDADSCGRYWFRLSSPEEATVERTDQPDGEANSWPNDVQRKPQSRGVRTPTSRGKRKIERDSSKPENEMAQVEKHVCVSE